MRSKSLNTMSTRRARRPDGRVYREMRKRRGSGSGGRVPILAWLIFFAVVLIGICSFLFFR